MSGVNRGSSYGWDVHPVQGGRQHSDTGTLNLVHGARWLSGLAGSVAGLATHCYSRSEFNPYLV